jgi:hypothetical protein
MCFQLIFFHVYLFYIVISRLKVYRKNLGSNLLKREGMDDFPLPASLSRGATLESPNPKKKRPQIPSAPGHCLHWWTAVVAAPGRQRRRAAPVPCASSTHDIVEAPWTPGRRPWEAEARSARREAALACADRSAWPQYQGYVISC